MAKTKAPRQRETSGKRGRRGSRHRRGQNEDNWDYCDADYMYEEEYYEQPRAQKGRHTQGTFDAANILSFFTIFSIFFFERLLSRFFPTVKEKEHRQGRADSEPGDSGHEGAGKQPEAPEAKQDPFEVLEIERGSGPEKVEEVKKAFKVLARKWHPDKNGGSEESMQKMQAVNWAYEMCMKELEPGELDEDEMDMPETSSSKARKKKGSNQDPEDEEDLEAQFKEFKKKRRTEQKKFRDLKRKAMKKSNKKEQSDKHTEAHGLEKPELTEATSGSDGRAGEASSSSFTVFDDSAHDLAVAIRFNLFTVFTEILHFERRCGLIDDLGGGNTPLHFCCHFGRREMAENLISSASDNWWRVVSVLNSEGKTPLEVSREAASCPLLTEHLQRYRTLTSCYVVSPWSCDGTDRSHTKTQTRLGQKKWAEFYAGVVLRGRPAQRQEPLLWIISGL
ncbi:hypothetical protein CYMTET_27801 [Cymbomonas tetramitiformis]|uniref:J domain-containing protein n=1 Tax=Cymbomonas tetramitiformis TaxID=36881 RepID=A0AAE0KWT6_9CHLO|nr:hypothetical protein CYMTET_27801 [Cymbomonas tetramitiformis]